MLQIFLRHVIKNLWLRTAVSSEDKGLDWTNDESFTFFIGEQGVFIPVESDLDLGRIGVSR